jgi:NADPH-dependent 2,4-dienoyl-CoA reductase/sulfur reductase-like enzyme
VKDNHMHRKYIIIGAGIAGISAAQSIRERDPSGQITILTDEAHRFYSRPGLAYVLNGLIPEDQLFTNADREIVESGAKIRVGSVQAIEPESKHVIMNGSRISYDALLLAVGARAALPRIPGIDLIGVVTLDNFDNLQSILKFVRRARSAVVIGGGITALELAEGLAARKVQTHYLLRSDRFWPSVLDEHESRLVETNLTEEGIHLHHNTEVTRVLSKRGHVQAVETKNGRIIDCQLLGVAIGIQPRLELARTAQLKMDRGILVDELMQSSIPGIFAAGDVAQVYDPVSNDYRLDSLWWVAREQGRVAGENMTGRSLVYHKPAAFNVTQIGGITTTIIGLIGQNSTDEDLVAIMRGDSETWRDAPQELASELVENGCRLRITLGERHVLGALIMGSQELSGPLQDLIINQVDISPIRDLLKEKPLEFPQLITRFWEEWKANQRECTV